MGTQEKLGGNLMKRTNSKVTKDKDRLYRFCSAEKDRKKLKSRRRGGETER